MDAWGKMLFLLVQLVIIVSLAQTSDGDSNSVYTYEEGDNVELACNPSDSDVIVRWSKLDGALDRNLDPFQRTLVLDNVTASEAGTYRCTMTFSNYEQFSDLNVVVISRPIIDLKTYEEHTMVAPGSPAQLKCDALGSPRPTITWFKENGDLPPDHEMNLDGSLYIPRAKETDAGIYKCSISNQQGTAVYPFQLFVGALVPYFAHDKGNAYLEFATLQDVYQDLDILLSFRPESTDGLLLYNGQLESDPGNYVCFGLQQQIPVFRYDIGSGPAIIQGNRTLELNKWHTVLLKLSKNNGFLLVDDESPYYGPTYIRDENLDLKGPLYLGSVPDFAMISRATGFTSGIVGSLSQVQVKGVNMNLGAEARRMKNVVQYNVCEKEQQCQSGSVCRTFNIRNGYVCDCPSGYVGERCEHVKEGCTQDVCGSLGRCVRLPSGQHSCICPAGWSGDGCLNGYQIADPAFNRTSFISYAKISDSLVSVRISLDFSPRSLDDGIIIYNALKADGKQDFIAVVIRNRHLEFRFDTGAGVATLKSRQPLSLNEWTSVTVNRNGQDCMMIVNNELAVRELIKYNVSTELEAESYLFLGGADPEIAVLPGVDTLDGFVGCVSQLTINEMKIDIIGDALETLDIIDCSKLTSCLSQPCQNNATCTDLSTTEFACRCMPGFSGQKCDIHIESSSDMDVGQYNLSLNGSQSTSQCHNDSQSATRCFNQSHSMSSHTNDSQCVTVGPNHYECNLTVGWSQVGCLSVGKLTYKTHCQGEGYIEVKAINFHNPKPEKSDQMKTSHLDDQEIAETVRRLSCQLDRTQSLFQDISKTLQVLQNETLSQRQQLRLELDRLTNWKAELENRLKSNMSAIETMLLKVNEDLKARNEVSPPGFLRLFRDVQLSGCRTTAAKVNSESDCGRLCSRDARCLGYTGNSSDQECSICSDGDHVTGLIFHKGHNLYLRRQMEAANIACNDKAEYRATLIQTLTPGHIMYLRGKILNKKGFEIILKENHNYFYYFRFSDDADVCQGKCVIVNNKRGSKGGQHIPAPFLAVNQTFELHVLMGVSQVTSYINRKYFNTMAYANQSLSDVVSVSMKNFLFAELFSL